MSEPRMCDTKPCVKEMEAGTYYWCSCGLSGNQPFCDGSHKGTGMAPVKHEVAEAGRVAWCMCKHNGEGATCDGSHAKLRDA